MKALLAVALLSSVVLLSGCLKDDVDGSGLYPQTTISGGGSGSNGGGGCLVAPAGADDQYTQTPCPSNVGDWTLTLTSYNTDGSIDENNMFCGYPDSDIPADQADFDGRISNGDVSANNFVRGTDCASGGAVDSGSGQAYTVIYNKQK